MRFGPRVHAFTLCVVSYLSGALQPPVLAQVSAKHPDTQAPAASQSSGRALLAKEPEIQAAGGMIDSWNAETQKDPNDPSKMSAGATAFAGYATLRNRMVLMQQLETRLQEQTVSCGFCVSRQAELSELLRQELAWSVAYGSVGLSTFDPIGDAQTQMANNVRQHYGQPVLAVDPEKQRWTTLNAGYEEASEAMKYHCQVLYPGDNGGSTAGPLQTCLRASEFGDEPSETVFDMARAHEKAWASCFQRNNWVVNEHQRVAYETCMSADDPLTKLCAETRRARPELAKYSCPKTFVVHEADIRHLLNWTDRYEAHAPKPYVPVNPATAAVDIFPERRLGVDIELLDPVIRPGAGQVQMLRGAVARDIPGSSSGGGAIIAIPKGTRASLNVTSYGGGVNINLISLTLANGSVIAFQNQIRSFPDRAPADAPHLPSPGSGDAINYALPSNCKYPMLATEFAKNKTAYAASLGVTPVVGRAKGQRATSNKGPETAPVDDFVNRRIYARSILAVTVMQDLDLNAARAGALIRGEMQQDITDYDASSHPDGLHVPRNTEVYFRVTAKPDDIRPYMQITVTPDHLLYRGLDIPLVGKPMVYKVVSNEDPASTPTATPATPRPPQLSIGGLLGAARRQAVPAPKSSGVPPANLPVVKNGALVMVNLTQDTSVRNGTPATETTNSHSNQATSQP